MTKIKNITLAIVVILVAILSSTALVACTDNEEETKNNYPVVGIWHATATWHEDNPYNYGGDTYKLDVYFDFREDGTLKNKRTLSLNGYSFNDSYSDWVIVNVTWSVKDNVITLSSGKQFVIVDDEFNDTYPNPKMILHYKKENSF
jgi:lipoprotein